MSEPTNFFRALAGVPVLYDRIHPSDYGVTGVPHDFHVPPDFQAGLERGFQDLWDLCPLGKADTILSAGTYSDRPPSQHAAGRAMDIDAIIWPTRRFVTLNYPTDSVFYLAVESVLRRNFDYVLTYLYNSDHHDHFHVDLSGKIGFNTTQETKVNYIQAYCSKVLGLPVAITGHWNPTTQDALAQAQQILGVSGALTNLAKWKEFLRAAAAHAFAQALQAPAGDPHHANIVALNNAIEVGMAGHPLRKFALSQVAELHKQLRGSVNPAGAPAVAANAASLTGPIKGIDTSAMTTGKGQQIKAKGYDAVGVYLRSDRCSKDMIADLKQAGLKIWSTYEKGHPDHDDYFTKAQGQIDGAKAAQFAASIGQPQGTQIYATVDYDADGDDTAGPTINGRISDYMAAFQKAIQPAGYLASVYGSGRTCRILIAKGLASTGWLTVSSSFAEHIKFKPNASIVQVSVINDDWDGDTIADPSKPGLW